MENTIKDSILRLEKMGLEKETIEKLLEFKNENNDPIYDSAFKICDLTEDTFVEGIKNAIQEEEAKEIYKKASGRKEFVSRYIENAIEMTEPHYRAQRCCNIDHDTVQECENILNVIKGE